MRSEEVLFHEYLNAISQLTGFALNDTIVEFYRNCLARHGFRRVNAALNTLMRSVKRWPTVEDIEIAMGIVAVATPTIEDHAREATARIWEAMSKFGYYRHKEAEEHIGTLGWLVVARCGGWREVCMTLEDQRGILTAQWRDLAISLYRFAQQGADPFTGPSLPKANPLGVALALIENGPQESQKRSSLDEKWEVVVKPRLRE